ncbi:hypothetical protein EJB05_37559 [Eragrostis curvula]|uniref:HMA domain-containing protein n=1 Tax=Eragrostis curvula TaxID=38414 RepID=A0A5J9TRV2_9POAL|nr:hypothetical protein EJB05_37559 [Eragrostis curvula]
MRKEMLIRVKTSSEKGAHCKAIKVAAGVQGVESVTIAGEDKSLLLVIGVGVDSNQITKKLRQKVGHAEVVELRTVDAGAEELGLVSAAEHAYRYNPSPYRHQQQAVARDHYYAAAAGGSSYPRDNYYTTGGGGASTYVPSTMAAGARDYYYGGGGGGGGGYQAPYQQQHYYQAPPANMHTVVHHEYAEDPNNCSIM